MIASSIFLERSFAFRTNFHFRDLSFRRSIVSGDFFGVSNADVVVSAEFAFVPWDVVDCAGFVAAAATDEDGAVCAARVELTCLVSW